MPIRSYQQDLIFSSLAGVETTVVYRDLCVCIKSLSKAAGVLSKPEV